jgi:hypothetical protein
MLSSDVAIAAFSLAGLAATAVAIVIDTRTQASDLARERVRPHRPY